MYSRKDDIPLKDRLVSQIGIGCDGCWNWVGCLTRNGYGQGTYKQKRYSAHRASYSEFIGPIPSKLLVLHKCDNRRCINPEHLFIGTAKENTLDMVKKGRNRWTQLKDACLRGHKMTGSNVYYNERSKKRACKACRAHHEKKHRESKKASALFGEYANLNFKE